jgi:hypothetical protein
MSAFGGKGFYDMYLGLKPRYNKWILRTDEFFMCQSNTDRIISDNHGYCILDGLIRVDVWNPEHPDSDIYKEEREAFNIKWNK